MAVNFPNGVSIQPYAVTWDDGMRKAYWADSTGIVRWTDNPTKPGSADALVWDLSGNLTIAQAITTGFFRVPLYTTGTLPAAGNKGNVLFTTDDNNFRIDNGTTWVIITPFSFPITTTQGGTGQNWGVSSGIPSLNAGVFALTAFANGSYLKSTATGVSTQTTPLPTADLASGAASASTFLRGDQTWVSPLVRSWLSGCQLSNDGASPNTVLDVSAGQATSDDQTTTMNLTAITGSTGGTFVVGTGNTKLDTGTIAINTWYHVFVIERTDTGIVDILFSTSATTPTLPANYTKKRRVGSFKTASATTNILAFTQDGDYFRWAASVQDLSQTTPSNSAVTQTLASVPLGVTLMALLQVGVIDTAAAGVGVLLSDLAANDEAPSLTASPGETVNEVVANQWMYGAASVRTNTLAQIRWRAFLAAATSTLKINTLGWIDTRGRNA